MPMLVKPKVFLEYGSLRLRAQDEKGWHHSLHQKNRKRFVCCQTYVDDIIFGSRNQDFCEEFGEMMTQEFEMSMIRELSFFLDCKSNNLEESFLKLCFVEIKILKLYFVENFYRLFTLPLAI
jgi:hypothetical protein